MIENFEHYLGQNLVKKSKPNKSEAYALFNKDKSRLAYIKSHESFLPKIERELRRNKK